MFFIDQLSPIWPEVEAEVTRDRLQYVDLYKTVEKYLEERGRSLALGSTTGVNLLLERDRTLNDYTYEIYAENAFVFANELANRLAETLAGPEHADDEPTKVIYLRTSIPYQRYSIVVDTRPMLTLVDLGRGRGETVSPMEIISPVAVKTFDKLNTIYVLSPEMQLIDMYRVLYSPGKAEHWEVSLQYENRLFHHILPTLTEVKKRQADFEKSGGLDEIEGGAKDERGRGVRERVFKALLESYIRDNPRVVLIGEHALEKNRTIPGTDSMVIQIIVDAPIDEVFENVHRAIVDVAGPDLPVTKVVRPLHIMQDFRILRTAVRIGDVQSGEQREVLYFYNAAQYDLIPMIQIRDGGPAGEHFYQIGNPFVVLRFLLLDLWMLRWVIAAGGINEAYGKYRSYSVMERILTLRSRLSRTSHIATIGEIRAGEEGLQIFQPTSEDYFGRYEDEGIWQKEKIKKHSEKFPDYYPQRHYQKNKSYRVIS
jgi:hypothetical protein